MVAAEQSRLPAVCRRYGVRRLEIFGSAARQDLDPRASDLDLLVEFNDSTIAFRKRSASRCSHCKKRSSRFLPSPVTERSTQL
jgi:predicted nucleotidyltransferase